jgi:hypothetical protein
MKILRKAIHQVLLGNVTYKGSVVKIYDEKVFTGESPNLYILYGTQRDQDITGQDCTWETKSSIDILIISRTASETSKDALDDISNSILELLLNLPGSDNLAAQSGYQIAYMKRESAVCGMMDITPTETKLTKVITLTATIIQQN